MNEAVIVSAVRTAVGKAPNGTLRGTRPDELAATVIAEALRRAPGIDPSEIDDVILGCAMPEAEQGLNVARIASLRAGIPVSASAVTINRFCSSGLQAIAFAAERIMCGLASAIVAGGTESMSLVPMGGHKVAPNPTLIDHYPGRLPEHRARRREPRARIAHLARGAGRLRAAEPSAGDRRHRRRPVRRRDRAGHRLAASSDGRDGGNTPGTAARVAFAVDEGPRRDTSLEALAKLRPAFHVAGTVTAGNSSQTSDGAAAVIVTSAERARERPDAARAVRRLRDGRRRAGAVRHRSGSGDPEGAEAGRPDARPDRSRRAERSLRRAGARVPEGTADRPGSAERQRRRHCARPPARLHRRQTDDDAAVRDEAARRRATAWSRCASAAAWAPPEFSKGCRSGLQGTRYAHARMRPVRPARSRRDAQRSLDGLWTQRAA